MSAKLHVIKIIQLWKHSVDCTLYAKAEFFKTTFLLENNYHLLQMPSLPGLRLFRKTMSGEKILEGVLGK